MIASGQLKLKEITEYYPKTKSIKNHYFVIKPEKEIYHGTFEVYRQNGYIEERGYFDHGIKTFFVRFDANGRVIKEFSDFVITTNTYFSNGELKSTERTKNGEPFGTWNSYNLNECEKPFLASSIDYHDGEINFKSKSISHIFLGVFSMNTLVTQDLYGNIDTTQVNASCDVIYPPEALRNRIEGTLFIKINMTDNCDFTYELINELGYGIEDQFIDKLELAKKSLEGKKNCQNLELTVPIKFELQ